MKYLSTITALTLVAMLAILPGCDNAPPDEIKVVRSNSDDKPAEAKPSETPAEAAPAEKPMEEAPAEAPVPEAAPAGAAGPVTYILEPNDENTLGFTGYKVTGKKQGGWSEYGGTVVITDGNIESTQIDINFQMGSLFSVAKMLTTTLLNEKWFNTEAFPEATFTSTSVKKGAEGYDVTGDLVIRGASVNITFPASIDVEDGTLSAQADFAVLRSDWGMVDTGMLDDAIKDEVRITFDIVAEIG